MLKSDFNYELPEELIAQTPLEPRDSSRLMKIDRASGEIAHDRFYNICDYLKKGDLLVMNDSKVFPARIFGTKQETGAAVQFLLLDQISHTRWEVMVKPGKRLKVGTKVDFSGLMTAEIVDVAEGGNRIAEFTFEGNIFDFYLHISNWILNKIPQINKDDILLDLYCGVGTITLAMAKAAGKVIGVEVVAQAVEDARENAKRNGIENAEFFCGDAGKAALELEKQGIRPDVVVVDPPRKGLNADTIEALARMSPRRIVYVSCDPATLARDVALLKERGYVLKNAQAADLFPRCSHVESVVTLVR